MKKNIALLSISAILMLSGCSYFSNLESKPEYPKAPEDIRKERAGSLTGDNGFVLFGNKRGDGSESGGNVGIGINSYLWRATLDTFSFMPLASADPFGGVIITDWYENPDAKGERFKANIVIVSKTLRSDAVKVSIFKQSNKSGSWRDVPTDEKFSTQLEDAILTRARELKIEKERK